MATNPVTLTLLALLGAAPLLLAADTTRDFDHRTSGVEALSPAVREILIAEMQDIQSGMMSVIPAFVAGRWAAIEEIGHRIRDGYIMKQSLTEAQRDQLHAAFPSSFHTLDAAFHDYAGKLSHAARARNTELVAFYYSRMMETCVACHAGHAGTRFPDLDREATGSHRH